MFSFAENISSVRTLKDLDDLVTRVAYELEGQYGEGSGSTDVKMTWNDLLESVLPTYMGDWDSRGLAWSCQQCSVKLYRSGDWLDAKGCAPDAIGTTLGLFGEHLAEVGKGSDSCLSSALQHGGQPWDCLSSAAHVVARAIEDAERRKACKAWSVANAVAMESVLTRPV